MLLFELRYKKLFECKVLFLVYFLCNIVGDKLLLNFGAKWQRFVHLSAKTALKNVTNNIRALKDVIKWYIRFVEILIISRAILILFRQ